jgi:hypothetical protein
VITCTVVVWRFGIVCPTWGVVEWWCLVGTRGGWGDTWDEDWTRFPLFSAILRGRKYQSVFVPNLSAGCLPSSVQRLLLCKPDGQSKMGLGWAESTITEAGSGRRNTSLAGETEKCQAGGNIRAASFNWILICAGLAFRPWGRSDQWDGPNGSKFLLKMRATVPAYCVLLFLWRQQQSQNLI